ncbi:MAG: AraC family transcriptional regulator [Ruminococcus sp.]|nr:AraC family transcriptional regulator [Ruminococcus sp.]
MDFTAHTDHTGFEKKLQEDVDYDSTGVPLYIRTKDLRECPKRRVPCHWHDDLELIYIWEGRMRYCINDSHIVLRENDTLLVNARQLHYGYPYAEKECRFSCVRFHPSLFVENKLLREKYITPILEKGEPQYVHFHSSQILGREISELMRQIVGCKDSAETAYEMEAVAVMHTLWCRFLRYQELFADEPDREPGEARNDNDDLEIQKQMITFIHRHYAENLSIEDIAVSARVSQVRCRRIFKQYLQQTPLQFLNAYRLEVSGNLLRDTDQTVMEIGERCGYRHKSHFAKAFSKCYRCTPREYRKKYQGEA